MPNTNLSGYDLTDLIEFAANPNTSTADRENAIYEVKFRQEMIEVCLKGGDRPTHNPPNP